jgi:charged multivesicular body protein 4A/B
MDYLSYFGNQIYNFSVYIYNSKPYKSKYSTEEINNLIKNLRNIQNTITNRLELIDDKIRIFLEKSKIEYSKNKKKNAINFLKIKKLYEHEKEKLESINFNIEVQIMSVESMGLMIETTETLKNTSTQIKTINNNLDFDKIETTIEELQDQHELGKELQSIISNPLNHEFDEDELLEELKEFDNNENNTDMPIQSKNSISSSIKMPLVPNHEIIINNSDNNSPKNDIKIQIPLSL